MSEEFNKLITTKNSPLVNGMMNPGVSTAPRPNQKDNILFSANKIPSSQLPPGNILLAPSKPLGNALLESTASFYPTKHVPVLTAPSPAIDKPSEDTFTDIDLTGKKDGNQNALPFASYPPKTDTVNNNLDESNLVDIPLNGAKSFHSHVNHLSEGIFNVKLDQSTRFQSLVSETTSLASSASSSKRVSPILGKNIGQSLKSENAIDAGTNHTSENVSGKSTPSLIGSNSLDDKRIDQTDLLKIDENNDDNVQKNEAIANTADESVQPFKNNSDIETSHPIGPDESIQTNEPQDYLNQSQTNLVNAPVAMNQVSNAYFQPIVDSQNVPHVQSMQFQSPLGQQMEQIPQKMPQTTAVNWQYQGANSAPPKFNLAPLSQSTSNQNVQPNQMFDPAATQPNFNQPYQPQQAFPTPTNARPQSNVPQIQQPQPFNANRAPQMNPPQMPMQNATMSTPTHYPGPNLPQNSIPRENQFTNSPVPMQPLNPPSQIPPVPSAVQAPGLLTSNPKPTHLSGHKYPTASVLNSQYANSAPSYTSPHAQFPTNGPQSVGNQPLVNNGPIAGRNFAGQMNPYPLNQAYPSSANQYLPPQQQQPPGNVQQLPAGFTSPSTGPMPPVAPVGPPRSNFGPFPNQKSMSMPPMRPGIPPTGPQMPAVGPQIGSQTFPVFPNPTNKPLDPPPQVTGGSENGVGVQLSGQQPPRLSNNLEQANLTPYSQQAGQTFSPQQLPPQQLMQQPQQLLQQPQQPMQPLQQPPQPMQQSPQMKQPFNNYPQQQQQQFQQQQTMPRYPVNSAPYPQQQYSQPTPNHGYPTSQFQNQSTKSGFNRLWGVETIDLLQTRNILPMDKVQPPKIQLGMPQLDEINCSPDVFRCTLNRIPESSSLLNKTRLPLGILIHPFRDVNNLPVVQCSNIVRCRTCRTYINPFVFFVDNKRWKCNLCFRVNELPDEFQYDPVSRTYGDPSRRPEVRSSTIEYIAPSEYMLRPPQPAVYLFLLDISSLAVESGYLNILCDTLIANLDNLPGDSRTQIGFICFNSAVHFYSLAEGFSQPHEMILCDIDDVFLPSPENLLVNLRERKELVKDLLTQLPTRYEQSHDDGSALGAALQIALKIMTPTGGRVSVFQCTLPKSGPGALQSRENPSQRSTCDPVLLNPATDFYKRLALESSAHQIAVDLFVLNRQYVDIATISGICKFSAGCLYHYPLFKSKSVNQARSFEHALKRYFTRKIGYEAVMRMRCSRGLSIHTFHGNLFVRSTDLLSLPNCNPDTGFGMQIQIDENLSDLQTICFQAALLYTSSRGERRIRVHTICLPISASMQEILNSADQQCIIGLLSKMAVDRSISSSLSDAKDAFINAAVDILSAYKLSLNMGVGSGSGLTVNDNLKLLPLYIIALLKHTAFKTGANVRLDDRVYAMCQMKTLPLTYLVQEIYPDLYPVHLLSEQSRSVVDEKVVFNLPRLQLSAEKLEFRGVFLLDHGTNIYIYIGHNVAQDYLSSTFGFPQFNAIPDECYDLPVTGTPSNELLHSFIAYLNEEKPYPAVVQIVRDNSPTRVIFTEKLIEDRIENGLSYYEFLQYLREQVK